MVGAKGGSKAVCWGLHSVDALVATKASPMAVETAAWKGGSMAARKAANWGTLRVVPTDC